MSVKAFLESRPGRMLETHMQQKYINRYWLEQVQDPRNQGKAAQLFPYAPQSACSAKVMAEGIMPKAAFAQNPEGVRIKNAFLINIPLAHRPMEHGYTSVTTLVKRLRDESFAATASESRPQARKKLALVIGVNQLHSLDAEANRAFRTHVHDMPCIDGLPHRVFGFFWKPQWKENCAWKNLEGVKEALTKKPILAKRLYSPEQAFFITKNVAPYWLPRHLSFARGEQIRKQLEGGVGASLPDGLRAQIPFQALRETIKVHRFTEAFACQMAKMPQRPTVFYFTMDGDCLSLRTSGKGYFSHCEQLITDTQTEQGFTPSVITLGYQLDESAPAIPRLAVKCDMPLRVAMNKVIGGSVYPPEPGAGYNLSTNGNLVRNLKAFSFLARTGLDKNAFESRRAIDNGVRKGLLDLTRFVFGRIGALLTAMPSRMMKSPACKKYPTLGSNDLKRKEVLSALRGVSQVHFKPLAWAHYLWEGLPAAVKKGSGSYGKVSGIVAQAFAVFDPIGMVLNYSAAQGGDFASAFDEIFAHYRTYLDLMLAGERGENLVVERGAQRLVLPDELAAMGDFTQGQFALLLTVKQLLADAHFSEEWVQKVILAAHASGSALFETLQAELDA
jgi:hypothetical protein